MRSTQTVALLELRLLSGYLRTIPADRFDIRSWVTQEPRPAQKLLGFIKFKPECGFAGCAIGWAMESKLFPDLTLSISERRNGSRSLTPEFMGHYGWSAVQHFFGINAGLAYMLFSGDRYANVVGHKRTFVSGLVFHEVNDAAVTPHMVADRIDRLCRIVEGRRNRQPKKKELPAEIRALVDA